MDILLPGQKPNLDRWRVRPFWRQADIGPTPKSAIDAYERVVAQEPPGPPVDGGAFRRVAEAIMRYDVFPRRILTPVLERTPVQLGDTVGGVSPLFLGLRLFFASRVIETFDSETDGVWRTGFTYRTLHGHPELGDETFSVEKDLASGAVKVRFSSWSQPGGWLAQRLAPRMRKAQVWANKNALDHLERLAAESTRANWQV